MFQLYEWKCMVSFVNDIFLSFWGEGGGRKCQMQNDVNCSMNGNLLTFMRMLNLKISIFKKIMFSKSEAFLGMRSSVAATVAYISLRMALKTIIITQCFQRHTFDLFECHRCLQHFQNRVIFIFTINFHIMI